MSGYEKYKSSNSFWEFYKSIKKELAFPKILNAYKLSCWYHVAYTWEKIKESNIDRQTVLLWFLL